jgi:septum formation protein
MKLPSIILASNSPRRAELLRQSGIEFQIVPSDAPEIHREQMTAREMSQINAYRKARSVAKRYPDALVLAADTLVSLETELFGKPATLEAAYQMLERLAGRTHEVVTGICLLHLRSHRQRIISESTTVTFRALDAVKIRRYLSKVNPLDKAGAYAIQEAGDEIIERVAGSYSNVVGLPMERVRAELGSWGSQAGARTGLSLLSTLPPNIAAGRASHPRQFLP